MTGNLKRRLEQLEHGAANADARMFVVENPGNWEYEEVERFLGLEPAPTDLVVFLVNPQPDERSNAKPYLI